MSTYTTVLREVQSAGMEVGPWPSVGVTGPTSRVLLSMESSLPWEDGAERVLGQGGLGMSAWRTPPMGFIWLGTMETPLCPATDDREQT